MLSIIVPVYNTEEYLETCIESILQQNYRDIELILVNDCSTDSSGVLCDKYAKADARVVVIHQTEQAGPIHARYAGLMRAKYDYVTFVDSDDWIAPSMHECLMEIMLREKVDMVESGVIRYWDEKDYKYAFDYTLQEGIYEKSQIHMDIIPMMIWDEQKDTWGIDPTLCSKIFRKEKLYQHYEHLLQWKYHYGEDVAVVYPYILEAESLYITHECYYYHRQRTRGSIAPYIISNRFYSSLLNLFESLNEVLKQYEDIYPILLKQLDLFYIYSINLRKSIYGETQIDSRYLFPFDKVDKGSRIVLYGAGMVGRSYLWQLKKIPYCDSIEWVDRNYKNYQHLNVKGLKELGQLEYDYLVIANTSPEARERIKEDLQEMGVDSKKIVY